MRARVEGIRNCKGIGPVSADRKSLSGFRQAIIDFRGEILTAVSLVHVVHINLPAGKLSEPRRIPVNGGKIGGHSDKCSTHPLGRGAIARSQKRKRWNGPQQLRK